MFEKKNPDYGFLGIVFCLGVGAGLLLYLVGSSALSLGEYGSVRKITEEVEKENSRSQVGRDIDQSLSYEEAVEQYDGRRIQFVNCLATPSSMTLKNVTRIMLDNRSADPHEIRVDGVPHRLWGYEFKVVTLSNNTLPHTVSFDCESAGTILYNAAEVLLQN